MRKQGLVRQLARKTGVTRAEAADQVDRVVHDILMKLRSGEDATWPGVGQFSRDSKGVIAFQQQEKTDE
jgi:nucleoid DNA-binding protein